jgi:hypothetical protein
VQELDFLISLIIKLILLSSNKTEVLLSKSPVIVYPSRFEVRMQHPASLFGVPTLIAMVTEKPSTLLVLSLGPFVTVARFRDRKMPIVF